MSADNHRMTFDSPLGRLTLVAQDDALVRLDHENEGPDTGPTDLLVEAKAQLNAYFDGTRQAFDLPLAPRGTPRQGDIWRALCDIPYGHWWSYQQIAETIQSSARAVGGACAANPLPILIPCHRVLNANGKLGHYSFADGAKSKHQLLRLEGAMM